MNLSEFSQKIANNLTADLNYTEDNQEIVAYAIETIFLTVLEILFIIVLGLILNSLGSIALAALFGGTLRKLSGGAHFSTPLKCLLFGGIAYSLVGLLAKRLVLMGFSSLSFTAVILVVSLFIVGTLAPVDSEAKPLHSRSFKIKLRGFSIAFVVATLIAVYAFDNPYFVTSAALGVFFQSITLLPIFNRGR